MCFSLVRTILKRSLNSIVTSPGSEKNIMRLIWAFWIILLILLCHVEVNVYVKCCGVGVFFLFSSLYSVNEDLWTDQSDILFSQHGYPLNTIISACIGILIDASLFSEFVFVILLLLLYLFLSSSSLSFLCHHHHHYHCYCCYYYHYHHHLFYLVYVWINVSKIHVLYAVLLN